MSNGHTSNNHLSQETQGGTAKISWKMKLNFGAKKNFFKSTQVFLALRHLQIPFSMNFLHNSICISSAPLPQVMILLTSVKTFSKGEEPLSKLSGVEGQLGATGV